MGITNYSSKYAVARKIFFFHLKLIKNSFIASSNFLLEKKKGIMLEF